MNQGFIKRLEDLERNSFQKPLIILARNLDSGEEFKMTVKEFIATPGLDFVKVITGGNLIDLDRLLENLDERIKEGTV